MKYTNAVAEIAEMIKAGSPKLEIGTQAERFGDRVMDAPAYAHDSEIRMEEYLPSLDLNETADDPGDDRRLPRLRAKMMIADALQAVGA